jgi:hypothetical protein
VNFEESRRDTFRWGFDFSKPLKSARPSQSQIEQLRARFAACRQPSPEGAPPPEGGQRAEGGQGQGAGGPRRPRWLRRPRRVAAFSEADKAAAGCNSR